MHSGHRARMRDKLQKHGLSAFNDHEILEILLYATIPRGDTNALAHELINTFGSFSNVFDASYDELIKVNGIGDRSAALIKLVPHIAGKYVDDKFCKAGIVINSPEKAYEALRGKYIDKSEEIPSALFLNNANRLIAWAPIGYGAINTAEIRTRKLVESCINYNATQVILCHNHPSGIAIPSKGDIISTQNMVSSLKTINVRTIDHIIIAGNDYVSLAQSKEFDIIFD